MPVQVSSFDRVIASCLHAGEDVPRWMQGFRQTCWQDWCAHAPPTQRSEAYRYINLKPLLSANYNAPSLSQLVDFTVYSRYLHPDEHSFIFVNGMLMQQQSASLKTARSVRQALCEGGPRIRKLLSPAPGDYFKQLNNICFRDGIFLQVGPQMKLEKPVHLVFITSEEQTAVFCRNIIDIAAGGAAQVIESHIGTGGGSRYLAHTRTSIFLGEAASCDHLRFQNEDRNAYHLSSSECMQQKNSRLSLSTISCGAELARLESSVDKEGSGTRCDFRGLYLGKGGQVLDNHALITHIGTNGETKQRVRGIVKDKAKGVFTGNIHVRRNAQKTEASQLTKNLLIGKDCTIYTRPQLQIEADDVKCSHGATSAAVADADLLYLGSRGLDKNAAMYLLCRAHVEEIKDELPIASGARFYRLTLADFLAHS